MKSSKPLIVLTVIIVALLALSIFVLKRTMPAADSKRPLLEIPIAEINKLVIKKPYETISFEKTPAGWVMKEPYADLADPSAMDELIGSLMSFTVGSLVSENKERHSQFNVQEGTGTHIIVSKVGQEKPVLDAFVGKQAIGYTSSYYRPAGQDNVYIADNLPNWLISQAVSSFREHRMLPYQGEAMRVRFHAGKFDWSMHRSSDTWQVAGGTKPVDAPYAAEVLHRINALRAQDFSYVPEKLLVTGFNKPTVEIEIESSSGTVKGIIGGEAINAYAPEIKHVFGRTEGRDANMILMKQHVDDVLSYVKNIK